jgi:hypothetical protein
VIEKSYFEECLLENKKLGQIEDLKEVELVESKDLISQKMIFTQLGLPLMHFWEPLKKEVKLVIN